MEGQFVPTIPYKWSRKSNDSYEVSTFGDKRFSPLVAKLSDGRTIEEAYQLDVKGYRSLGSDWRLGKGKPPMIPSNDLPKITTHYFELKNDGRFNIFQGLIDICNCCSKLICNESSVRSVRDFIRIVKAEHSDKVNQLHYDTDDIVLFLVDKNTKSVNEKSYADAINSLIAAGTIEVKSIVTITHATDLAYMSAVSELSELISPKYTEIPGTGYFVDIYGQYKNLWNQWLMENPDLMSELAEKAHGKTLTDVYSNTNISQARALAEILNNFYNLK